VNEQTSYEACAIAAILEIIILKQMAPQELDKVLSIESYAKVTKRNGDDNELDSLKVMPLNGISKEKMYYPLGIMH